MMRTLGALVLGAVIATAGLLSAEPQDTKKSEKPDIKGGIEGDVKIQVRGTTSKQGLQDPAFKAGIPVTIVTEEGGRKVKEVKVAPPPAAKGKKAG